MGPDRSEVMTASEREVFIREVHDRLAFPRGVLCLLKDTQLFGPMVEQALEDIDTLIKRSLQMRS